MGKNQEGVNYMLSRPPLDRIAFWGISWYSLFIVTGVVLGVLLAAREEKRLQLPKDTTIDFAILAIPLALVGARLYYVFFQWDTFSEDLLSIFAVRSGGLAIYGGVLGGLLAGWLIAKRKQIALASILDMVAPSLVLGQAIGRWGNYFNMEAYGFRLSEPALQFFPFAVEIPVGGVWYWHMATFFYEFCWDLLVFALLMGLRRYTRRKGDVFRFYLLFYCAGRTVIEGLREDSLTFINEFVRVSQILSALACVAVVVLFFLRLKRKGQPFYILPVASTVLALAGCFIGEFERGAYANLFSAAQLLMLALLACEIASLALCFLQERRRKLKNVVPIGIASAFTLGVLLFGLGRADLNNQLFVSWRQIACMLHMIASGILLYPFRKQAPARAGA